MSDDVLAAARASAAAFADKVAEQVATLDRQALNKLADGADGDAVLKAEWPGAGMPLRFENEESEVNFYALLHCLDFGSGWNRLVGEKCGRPVGEAACFALISLHLEGNKLDAEALCQVSAFQLGVLLQLPITEEKEIAPAIRQDVPSDVKPLVEGMHACLHEVGRRLQETRHKSLGDFVLQSASAGEGSPPSAARLVTKLAATFKCFRDEANVEPHGHVTFHRKAMELAIDLHARFGAASPRLNFADADALIAGSDMRTVQLLYIQGVLRLENKLHATVSKPDALLPPLTRHEVGLRAAGVTACAVIAEALGTRIGKPVPVWRVYAFLHGREDDRCRIPEGIHPNVRDTVHY